MHVIDTTFGLDGWAAALILGALILMVPIGLMAFYLFYRYRVGSQE